MKMNVYLEDHEPMDILITVGDLLKVGQQAAALELLDCYANVFDPHADEVQRMGRKFLREKWGGSVLRIPSARRA